MESLPGVWTSRHLHQYGKGAWATPPTSCAVGGSPTLLYGLGAFTLPEGERASCELRGVVSNVTNHGFKMSTITQDRIVVVSLPDGSVTYLLRANALPVAK